MAESADLAGFLEAAGRSIADAQGSLAGDAPQIASMVAISEAELELKATLQRAPEGVLVVEPVSSRQAVKGGIDPGALSTVRIRYVAISEEAAADTGGRPVKTAKAVVDEVRARGDVAALDRILGGLNIEAEFAPASRRWVVTVRDPQQRPVRELVVVDTDG